jgi:hypothetical protein
MWAEGGWQTWMMWCYDKKSLHENCRMGRRIVVMNTICSLGHRECDGRTVHKLSQRRLTADWLAPRESDCLRIHSKISSDWLPSYIKATGSRYIQNSRILTGQPLYVSYPPIDTTPKSICNYIYSHVRVLPLERCTSGTPTWILIFTVANES